jgi:general L-amino acid transport system permease protein
VANDTNQAAVTTVKPAAPPIWNDPVYRAYFFQAVILALFFYFCYFIVSNTLHNLEKQGIASGFGFLNTTAGFSIGESLISYDEEDTYGRVFMVGLFNTMYVSSVGVVLATILGFLMGVARLSKNWLVARLATVYIEMMRNIPLLLQIFFWYFAMLRPLPSPRQSINFFDSIFLNNRGMSYPRPLPESGFDVVAGLFVLGIIGAIFVYRWAKKRQDTTGEQFPVFFTSLGLIVGLPLLMFFVMGAPLGWEIPELKGFNFTGGKNMSPEFVALLCALVMYTGAFIAEIVRAGINGVPHGQTEAALSVGLKNSFVLRLVVIPQAMRIIMPPLTSQYLNLTKNSSLAAAIAFPDIVLVFAGTTLMQTGQAVEVILMVMGCYLFFSLSISTVMNWYNRRIMLVER